MSLQTRLAALVAAVGADIKADRARLTLLETAPARQVLRGAIQSSVGYSSLSGSARPANAAQRVDLMVEAGTYILHASMSAYFSSVVSGPWNVNVRLADGTTIVTPIVSSAFYLNVANVHLTAPPTSGEVTFPTAGSISIWPQIGGLLTTADDRFDVVLIPKDIKGPKGDPGVAGPVGPAGDAPTSYAMDPWHSVGAAGQPAFLNSWVNFGGAVATAAFKKDPFGRVTMKGTIKSGSLAPIFTLPVGYIPASQVTFSVPAGPGGFLIVVIHGLDSSTQPPGTVLANNYITTTSGAGSNAYVYFDSIEFDIASIPTTILAGPKGDKGDVGLPPIVAKAHRTTSFNLTANVVTKMGWNSEDSDDSNIFNTDRFQPTRAGWYDIDASVFIDQLSGTWQESNFYLLKNSTGGWGSGTIEQQDRKAVRPNDGETTCFLNISHSVYFNGTTDLVELYVISNNGARVNVPSWFVARSVGAVGPAGPTGATGPTGPAGPAGSSDLSAPTAWMPFDLLGDPSWDHNPVFPFEWMLDTSGVVHLRGGLIATGAGDGPDFPMNYLVAPYTPPGQLFQTCVPGLNQTQEELGYWEVLGSGFAWHGPKANGDHFNMDGISYCSFIGGALGKKVTPTFAPGFSSDLSDPLVVYATDTEARWFGTVVGPVTASGAGTTMFTVPGMSSHLRTVFAIAMTTTVSGPNHPDTNGQDDFLATMAGDIRILPLYGDTNVLKIKFTGGFTVPELE